MNAHSVSSFFAMGGYAAYVWPAYAVFFIVLIADNVAPRLRRRRLLAELRARMARQGGRPTREGTAPTSTSSRAAPESLPPCP